MVKKGDVEGVRTLFAFSKEDNLFEFDHNVVDSSNNESVLTIATKSKNLSMCKLLLHFNVRNYHKNSVLINQIK